MHAKLVQKNPQKFLKKLSKILAKISAKIHLKLHDSMFIQVAALQNFIEISIISRNSKQNSSPAKFRPTTTDSQLPAIIVCNTADAARRFPELKSLEDRFEVVDLNPTTHIYSNDVDGRIRKEADDYWKCLNATHRLTTADYVMLLEDDALPTPAFPVLLESLARRLDER